MKNVMVVCVVVALLIVSARADFTESSNFDTGLDSWHTGGIPDTTLTWELQPVWGGTLHMQKSGAYADGKLWLGPQYETDWGNFGAGTYNIQYYMKTPENYWIYEQVFNFISFSAGSASYSQWHYNAAANWNKYNNYLGFHGVYIPFCPTWTDEIAELSGWINGGATYGGAGWAETVANVDEAYILTYGGSSYAPPMENGLNFFLDAFKPGESLPAGSLTVRRDLMAWFDANDIAGDGSNVTGSISTWVNKSNKSVNAGDANAVLGVPTVNTGVAPSGEPTVHFDGGDQMRTVTSAFDKNGNGTEQDYDYYAIFVAGKFETGSTSGTPMFSQEQGDTPSSNGPLLAYDRVDFHPTLAGIDPNLPLNKFFVAALIYNENDPNSCRLLLDGVEVYSSDTDKHPGFPDYADMLVLGGRDSNDVNNLFTGDIGELLVYTAALSDVEINDITDYLKNKWTPPPTMAVSPDEYKYASAKATTDAGYTCTIPAFDVHNSTPAYDDIHWTATVTSGSSWLSIASGSSGTNDGTITMALTRNTTGANRTGEVTITSSDTGVLGSPKVVSVTQGYYLSSNGTQTFSVKNNVEGWRDRKVPAGTVSNPLGQYLYHLQTYWTNIGIGARYSVNWPERIGSTGPIGFDLKVLNDKTVTHVHLQLSSGGAFSTYYFPSVSQTSGNGWVHYEVPFEAGWTNAQAAANGWTLGLGEETWTELMTRLDGTEGSNLGINTSSGQPVEIAIDNFTPAACDDDLAPITHEAHVWFDATDINGDGSATSNGTAVTTWKQKDTWDKYIIFDAAGGADSNNVPTVASGVAPSGLQTVHFDGTDWLVAPRSAFDIGPYTDGVEYTYDYYAIFVAGYFDPNNGSAYPVDPNYAKGCPLFSQEKGGSSLGVLFSDDRIDFHPDLSTNPTAGVDTLDSNLPKGEFIVAAMIYDKTATPRNRLIVNGVEWFTDNTVQASNDYANSLTLGSRDGNTRLATGDIGELIIFARKMEPAEFATIYGYLMSKWFVKGDTDSDNDVDLSDFSDLAVNWLDIDNTWSWDTWKVGDFDYDFGVDLKDVDIQVDNWLAGK